MEGRKSGTSLCSRSTRMKPTTKKKTPPPPRTDLIVLVAGKDDASAIKGILNNPQKLGVREIKFEILVHPGRDAGCLQGSVELLRSYLKSHEHALVIFDHEGCGKEQIKSR